MSVRVITDAELETEVLHSDVPVLIDFYADWCEPCKVLAPHIEAVAAERAGTLKVLKIDVEASPRAAAAFRVQSIPTLAVVSGGQILDLVQGALQKSQLDQWLNKLLGAPAGADVVQTLTVEQAAPAIAQGQIVAVDLRVENDFKRAHLPGAINVPVVGLADDEREAAFAELARQPGNYLFYTRASKEEAADLADKAATAGVSVAILEGGLLSWEVAGEPIEKSPRTFN